MIAINIIVRNKSAKNLREGTYEYVCGNSGYFIEFDFDEEWDEFDVKTARFEYNGTYQDVVFEGNAVEIPIISNTHKVEVGVFAGNLHTTTPAVFMAQKSILCGSGTPAAPPDDVYNQIMKLVERCLDDDSSVSEEDIRKALENYLAENPIETGATEEEAAQIQQNKEDIESLDRDKLSTSELNTAIDSALSKAKESGEFNGKDGQDGQDGSDGITPHIGSNGNWYIGETDTGKPSHGADGKDGQDGYTPQKGVDYFDGENGEDGADGKSAYQIAVNNGFEGTEAEWLESLHGEDAAKPFVVHFTAHPSYALPVTDTPVQDIVDAYNAGRIVIATLWVDHVGHLVYVRPDTVYFLFYTHRRGEAGKTIVLALLANGTTAIAPVETVLYGEAQTLTEEQKAQARANIGSVSWAELEAAKPDIVADVIEQLPIYNGFETDETLTLKNGVLSVNTTDQMEQDNTLPMTAAGVFSVVGNIEALLKTI